MLTLDDINKLPNDPTPEHLIALGLLPAPAPPPSIIPKANVAPMKPVTPASKAADWVHGVEQFAGGPSGAFRIGTGIGRDAAEPTSAAPAGDWKTKLANLSSPAPHAAATPLSPLPAAPDMGTPGIVPSPDSAASPFGMGNYPTLKPLNFKERQALPTTSEGVAPGSSQEALAKLERLQDQKNNPWGSAENHPGILGKIGHVAAKIGNIAGDILAPATMANIPGTDLNRQMEERRLEGQVAERSKAEEEAQNSAARRELEGAETQEAKARAAKLGNEGGNADILQDAAGNAVGWRDEKGTLHSLDEEGTPANIKSIAEKWEGKAAAKSDKQNLQQGLAGAVQEAIDAGRDPKTDEKVQKWQEAIQAYQPASAKDVKTAEDLKQRIAVAFEKGDLATVKQLQGELTALDPEGMARLAESQARAAEARENSRSSREDRQEKQGLKWVTGETQDGKTVTVPLTQAKAMDLKNMAEANADHVNKVLAARVVVPMIFSSDPTDPGVLQLIDAVDKKGGLGPLASRWNDFMARKWGAGDPLYAALRTRLDLAQTKMMQAHVGSRGGAFMLEHFEDLANAGKLDAATLRAALDQELKYMVRNSEKPVAGSPSSGGGAKSDKVQVHNGFEYTKGADGQWHRGAAVQP